MTTVIIAAVIILIVAGFMGFNRLKFKALANSPSGETRLERVKSRHANMTIQDYANAGWDMVGQSATKNLGSAPKVTLTFRKR